MASTRDQFAAKASFYFHLFMIAVYGFTGLMLIFVLTFLQIQPVNRVAAGCVLIIYALYRSFKLMRSRKTHSETKHENTEA